MAELIPRFIEQVAGSQAVRPHRGLSRRAERAVDRQLAYGCERAPHAQADTYASHALVDGAAFVAATALQRMGELSAQEAYLTGRTPHAERRFCAIADSYAVLAAQAVAKMGACQ